MEDTVNNDQQNEEGEPTPEESFQMLYSAAPKPIQKFLQEKKYETVSASLAHTYGLNIEQVGALSQGLVFLLLGAQSPQEFSESLKTKIGLTDEVNVQIVNDINKTVFLPLREQIQQEGLATSSQPTHDTPPPEQTEPLAKTPPVEDPSTPATQTPPSPTPEPATPTPPAEKEQSTTYTPLSPPTPPIPPSPETPSNSPLVKEYSVDPYREEPE